VLNCCFLPRTCSDDEDEDGGLGYAEEDELAAMQAPPEVAQSSLLPTITDPKLFVIRLALLGAHRQ
jgi:hypothetical protein